ncbi:hypothetical protein [Paenibacillus puerhi]|uniref:hypothetical protein n=1 Tax=Paenibacillus puerhi TaxID=2692622 RepID=UPI00135742C8|nr:hypothetical protein [Paenibacillus puerhi]
MENFISTIVFLLPGLMMYFWVQSFGINPVVKHSPTEMGALAALLWLPVSLAVLMAYNGIGFVYGAKQIWTLVALKEASGSLQFLTWFSFLSLPISYCMSYVYAKFVYPYQRKRVNGIRTNLGLAPLSEAATVWEEFFINIDKERTEGAIPVKIYKMDKPLEPAVVGLVGRASRPFETERALVLVRCHELKESHDYYEYQVDRKYVDIKSGLVVEELNLQKPTKNNDDNKDNNGKN